ncbi:nucleotide triphosphate diphosphatase NUDT15 [Anaerobacillus sp. MEB173]|uniref:nucleotide triphosphate diphosphatase NUDT15 n=1 Tax=Anaerobacillus sp. MEB173 TaxID=3383345 RepID=UPI003F8E2A22
MRYQFCPKCGGTLEVMNNEENKPRCVMCGFIFYQNPVVGVAAIVIKDCGILLGKRRGSYSNKWCIPCGYVEWDEDVYDAVKREFAEETGLQIKVNDVYTVYSNFHNPAQHTVGIWFLAEEIGGELEASDDLVEVDYFTSGNIPPLAFPTDSIVIEKLKLEKYIK